MNLRFRFLVALCSLCLTAAVSHAAGAEKVAPAEPQTDAAVRLVTAAAGDDVKPGDPRVAQARSWIAQTMKTTGEEEEAIAATSMRLSRYLFDVSKVRVSPLDVLEMLAKYAPAGKPLNETTSRYFDLRAKKNLGHAEAMAAMAGK
jgi:hypothetical protein